MEFIKSHKTFMSSHGLLIIIPLLALLQQSYFPTPAEWTHDDTIVKYTLGYYFLPLMSIFIAIHFCSFFLEPSKLVVDFRTRQVLFGKKKYDISAVKSIDIVRYKRWGLNSIGFNAPMGELYRTPTYFLCRDGESWSDFIALSESHGIPTKIFNRK